MLLDTRNKTIYGVGISTVLKIFDHFLYQEGQNHSVWLLTSHHHLLLDTRHKNRYGVGVRISTVFKYLGTSCLRGTGPHHMVMTYIPSDARWYKEQEYIQFWGGEFNSFKDIKLVPYCAPTGPPGAMTLTNNVWKLLCKFELLGLIGSWWEDLLNMFPL
jgi:hypothetical protein